MQKPQHVVVDTCMIHNMLCLCLVVKRGDMMIEISKNSLNLNLLEQNQINLEVNNHGAKDFRN